MHEMDDAYGISHQMTYNATRSAICDKITDVYVLDDVMECFAEIFVI